MNRLSGILVVLLLTGGCASESGSDRQQLTAETGERLLASPPDGWKSIFQVIGENTRLTDFVPADEDRVGWSTKVSFESHATSELSIDPIELLFSEAETDQSRCDAIQHFNIFSGFENNYQTSVRLFMCGENAFTHQGEIKLLKVIRGLDYLYSIRIVKRVPPFDINEADIAREEVALWSNYLSRMTVCDDSAEHPCP